MTSLRIVLVAGLLALAHAAPAPAPAPSPAEDDRPEIIEIIAPAASAQETLDSLNLGEPGSELSERNKRTIGILRQLFPTLTQIVEQKIQNITGSLFQTFGPLILNALSGSRNSNNNNNGVDTFDDDDDDDEDVETITKSSIKYAPDVEKVPNVEDVSSPEPIENLKDGTGTTTTSTEKQVLLSESTNNSSKPESSSEVSESVNDESKLEENKNNKEAQPDLKIENTEKSLNESENKSDEQSGEKSPIDKLDTQTIETTSEVDIPLKTDTEPKSPSTEDKSDKTEETENETDKRKRKRAIASY